MAKGKKTGGNNFKPGISGNPLGAAVHNQQVKSIRRLTQEDIAEIGSLILEGNLEKLKEVRANPNTTVLKVWICSVAIAAINKGDAQSLNALLDRIVGKAKERVELSGHDGGAILLGAETEDQKEIRRQALEDKIKKLALLNGR